MIHFHLFRNTKHGKVIQLCTQHNSAKPYSQLLRAGNMTSVLPFHWIKGHSFIKIKSKHFFQLCNVTNKPTTFQGQHFKGRDGRGVDACNAFTNFKQFCTIKFGRLIIVMFTCNPRASYMLYHLKGLNTVLRNLYLKSGADLLLSK